MILPEGVDHIHDDEFRAPGSPFLESEGASRGGDLAATRREEDKPYPAESET